jgi:hypothetical protein
MNANNESTSQDYDKELPDFSTPEWEEKWKNATFSPGEPIDLDSVRVRNLPDGTTVVSYDMLPEEGRDSDSRSIRPPQTSSPPISSGFETSPTTAKPAQGRKHPSG